MKSTTLVRTTIVTLLLGGGWANGQDVTFTSLSSEGDVFTTNNSAGRRRPLVVSADGSVVVGLRLINNGSQRGTYMWTCLDGVVPVGLPGTSGLGVSGDGTVVVGAHGQEAFRWTAAGGLVLLGDLPGTSTFSAALGASFDGSTIVGFGTPNVSGTENPEAFRWTAPSGLVSLGGGGGPFLLSRATAVSADGSVVVGEKFGGASPGPFRWTASTGRVTLASSTCSGTAVDVSADGSIVVGSTDLSCVDQAFRWTASGGLLDLGHLPGDTHSMSLAVSADGSVVVGVSQIGPLQPEDLSNGTAFIWDPVEGMRNLKMVLETEHGLDLSGWTLTRASDVSDDGQTIVGVGVNPSGNLDGWVVRHDAMDDTDGDGLTNQQEIALGTDRCNPDTDDDGVLDGTEIATAAGGSCPDPLNADSDADGVLDGDELALSADPCDSDSDDDQLGDALEIALGTDPTNPDTDGDGLFDGTEIDIAEGTGCPSPLNADSDGDTLLDGAEVALGIDPCSVDSDGDGLNDYLDPDPGTPDTSTGVLEIVTRGLCAQIQTLSLQVFSGPNDNARQGRRNALANRACGAANAIADSDIGAAVDLLESLLDKVDGEDPPPDWMIPSLEKSTLAQDVNAVIVLLASQ